MLRELFPRSGVTYERSPHSREMNEFCVWLQFAGYSKDSIHGHLRRLFKVLTDTHELGNNAPRSSVALYHIFARHCTCEHLSHTFRATERAYRRVLQAHGRLREAARQRDAVSLLLERYRQHLEQVRGFSEATAIQHEQTVFEFFGKVLRPPQNIRAITSNHVKQYLTYKSKHVSRQTMQHVVARLRAFFRYGSARGLVHAGLDSIDTPRTYRDELPPRALPWTLVKALLRR